jgi:hypothetical protein
MTAPFDNIVQQLFHQPSLHSVTVDELERVVQQNPSFATAQFLLLKKMQEMAHPGFSDQLRKTTLYFNNPLWLQFLLQPKKENTIASAEARAVVTNKEERVSFEEKSDKTDKIEHPTNVIEEEKISVEQTMEGNIPAPEEPVSVMEIAEQYNYNNIAEQSVPADHNTEATAIHLTEERIQPAANAEPEQEINYSNHIITPETGSANNIETITPAVTEEPVHQEPIASATQAENKADAFEADNTENPKTDHLAENAEQTLLLRTIVETTASKEDLLFEPYHTIDYFASQGIKLSKIEPEPQDKLGRQLKSFTEWLKMMKKLPPISVDKILAENEESQVVESANLSIETKEVITEAMAEVYEKQGLREKAASVYHKLSLLNPGKSAYFASRIEALK